MLLVGGLFYSPGVIFYVWETLVYHHAIWHLFVLAGSVSPTSLRCSCMLFQMALQFNTCKSESLSATAREALTDSQKSGIEV